MNEPKKNLYNIRGKGGRRLLASNTRITTINLFIRLAIGKKIIFIIMLSISKLDYF